ncbi:MAG: cyclic nucleotide-binding domain-containing protein [Myxococcaceae bacterium]|jgi:CRP-like cAMP-binding protein/tRNA A-37 threonylcarbamoyl transferase component Bud32|nr:cyclic nucleotide-binding domain-containing protein [Myxococcaceae bacterium]MCA3011293.1 cyclic nucleotide-binding domain-containing protein [Myxococcaceae bacterium]
MFWKKDDESTLTQPVPPGWDITGLGLLGKGGMARVFRVRDEALGREVALKVLRPELLKQDEALATFVDEARITAQLDHPNVPPVYALSNDRKRSTCFTMKVLEGQTFQHMLEQPRQGGIEALFAAIEVLLRVCDAVAFAHEKGIFHCDLKPGNVMVGTHGQIYVVDWGLARRRERLPKPGEDDRRAVGTPAYMAPEQARGQNHLIDERTDTFLLGGMLYRVLAGKPPYVAATAEATLELARVGAPPPPETVAPPGRPMPPGLLAICRKALSPEKADRFQTAGALRKELEDFMHGTAKLPEQVFQPGDVIVREGDPGDCAYIVLDGHCQVTRLVAGKRENLRLLGPGEMFGEAAVLTNNPRLATVTAIMETRVAVVQRSFLKDEMERTSLISLAIRAVASAFVDLNGQTAALLADQAVARAWEFVLREVAFSGRAEADGARSIAWRATLARAAEASGVEPGLITRRVQRQPGVRLDEVQDRLVVSPPRR